MFSQKSGKLACPARTQAYCTGRNRKTGPEILCNKLSPSDHKEITNLTCKPNSEAPLCKLKVGGISTFALIDSGAACSLIDRQFLQQNFRNVIKLTSQPNQKLTGVTGHALEVCGVIHLKICLGKITAMQKFFVINNLGKEILLGYDSLQNLKATIDCEQNLLIINKSAFTLKHNETKTVAVNLVQAVERYVIPPHSIQIVQGKLQGPVSDKSQQDWLVSTIEHLPQYDHEHGVDIIPALTTLKHQKLTFAITNNTNHPFILNKKQIVATAVPATPVPLQVNQVILQQVQSPSKTAETTKNDIDLISLGHIPESQRIPIRALIETNSHLFTEDDTKLETTPVLEMPIELTSSTPIHQAPYRVPLKMREQLDNHIDNLLKAGIISESDSPYASPVVIVAKPHSTETRMCIDFRKLNSITIRSTFPLPVIDDVLATLGKAKFFTTLDLKSAYFQCSVKEEDRPKTAFTTYRGHYQFNKVPFGLKNSATIFQRLITTALKDLINVCCWSYIDDVIVYSDTFENHLKHLQQVFDRLDRAKLKMRPSKCHFLKSEIFYLGHRISSQGIKPDPRKVSVIENMSKPTTVKQVRRFIGLIQFYRKFIPNCAKICRPLTQLTRKNAKFHWTNEHDEAFLTLKRCLTTEPILAFPDINLPYNLYTDASRTSIGSVLTQVQNGGRERVIQFVSQQLSPSQQKWSTSEQEMWAIVYSIKKLRPYLFGAEATIYTDHKSLSYVLNSPNLTNAKLLRWAMIVSEHDFPIKYLKGKANAQADFLSRLYTRPNVDQATYLQENESPLTVQDSQVNAISNTVGEEDTFALPHSIIDLVNLQYQDKNLQNIINKLSDPDLRPAERNRLDNFALTQEHLLCRITQPHKDSVLQQVVIPECLTEDLITLAHDHITSGHLSRDKTFARLASKYWFPNMWSRVEQHVKECIPCNSRKARTQPVPLQFAPIPNFPFEVISIDLVGPLTETPRGNRFLLTIICNLTSWPEAIPIPTKEASVVAEALIQHFITRFGTPRVIVSDNGREFDNSLMKYLSNYFGFIHAKVCPYTPHSNGKIEKFNQVLVQMLSIFADSSHQNWDVTVNSLLNAYRTSVHSSLQHTPYFLVFGRECLNPVDTLLTPRQKSYTDNPVATQMENLHKAYSLVRDKLKENRRQYKERYDRRAKQKSFEIGDPVYVADLPTTDKLSSKSKPYYRIFQQLSPVKFRVKHAFSDVTRDVHADHLIPAFPHDIWDKPPPTLPGRPWRKATLAYTEPPFLHDVDKHDDDDWSPEDLIPLSKLRQNFPIQPPDSEHRLHQGLDETSVSDTPKTDTVINVPPHLSHYYAPSRLPYYIEEDLLPHRPYLADTATTSTNQANVPYLPQATKRPHTSEHEPPVIPTKQANLSTQSSCHKRPHSPDPVSHTTEATTLVPPAKQPHLPTTDVDHTPPPTIAQVSHTTLPSSLETSLRTLWKYLIHCNFGSPLTD